MSGQRAKVTIDHVAGIVTKAFYDPRGAAAEAAWYQLVPWASPRLLDLDTDAGALVIEVRPLARDHPDWRPAAALAELLTALHAMGIHHRDVHLGNVVIGNGDQPLLIDWETATEQPSALSYDLHGPAASGVPVPPIHRRLTPQWWGSPQRQSIRSAWGCDVPTALAQRPGSRARLAPGELPL